MRIFKKITAVSASLVMLLTLAAASADLFTVRAVDFYCDVDTVSQAVYLENLNSQAVVYEKEADKQMYPASTTKIMTFIITAENVAEPDDTYVTIEQEVIEELDPESTVMGLSQHIGEEISVTDLLYGLMLPSGNDAALVLADYVGDGVSGFVEKMNAKAAELGCENTHFANPNGLYDSEHYSTARDMAVIAKYALNVPQFMEICNTLTYTPEGYDELHNTNYMLDPAAEDGMYYYQYAKGIKTGYLDEAGKCLVTSSAKDGEIYLCVCLGADYTFEENINYAMLDTAKLYDWAYDSLGLQTIFSPEESVAFVDVKYVRDGKKLSAVPETAVTAFLPNNYDNDLLKVDVSCTEEVEAPVTKGDLLGTVSIKYDDLDLGETNLVAAESVERNISEFEVFIMENITHIIIALIVIALLIFIILLLISSAKRSKRSEEPTPENRRPKPEQQNKHSNKKHRYKE